MSTLTIKIEVLVHLEPDLPVVSKISKFVWVLWSKWHQVRFASQNNRFDWQQLVHWDWKNRSTFSLRKKFESTQYYYWHKCELTGDIFGRNSQLCTVYSTRFHYVIPAGWFFELRMLLEIFLFWHSIRQCVNCFKFNEEKLIENEWKSPEIGWSLISFYFAIV